MLSERPQKKARLLFLLPHPHLSPEASDEDHLSPGLVVSKEVWAAIHAKPKPAS